MRIEIFSWVRSVIDATQQGRNKIKTATLHAIKYFARHQDKTPEAGEVLLKAISQNDKFEYIGFCTGITYVHDRIKGIDGAKRGDLFNHNFGMPTLVYKYKDFPALILCSGSLRLDESALEKVPENKTSIISPRGITS